MNYGEIKKSIRALEANAALWGKTRNKTSRQGILLDHYGHGKMEKSIAVREANGSSCMYQIVRLYRTWYVMSPTNSRYTQGEYLWAASNEQSCVRFLESLGTIFKTYPTQARQWANLGIDSLPADAQRVECNDMTATWKFPDGSQVVLVDGSAPWIMSE